MYASGEFNYQFDSDEARDAALEAAVAMLEEQANAPRMTSAQGAPLEGALVRRDDREWFSAYLRVATNELRIVRSYVSAGDADVGSRLERSIRQLFELRFQGVEVE